MEILLTLWLFVEGERIVSMQNFDELYQCQEVIKDMRVSHPFVAWCESLEDEFVTGIDAIITDTVAGYSMADLTIEILTDDLYWKDGECGICAESGASVCSKAGNWLAMCR